FARRAGFVTLRQTFVRRCHSSMLPLGSGEAETGDARSRDGGVREELARAKQTTLESKPERGRRSVEAGARRAAPRAESRAVRTARSWRGIFANAPSRGRGV